MAYPVNIDLFNVNNKSIRKRCSGVFIFNLYILHLLVFLFLTLNK